LKKEGTYIFHQSILSGKYSHIYLIIIIIFVIIGCFIEPVWGNWAGFSAAIIGPILLFFSNAKLEIDTSLKKFRHVINLPGITYGKWDNLLPLDYVSVRGITYARRKRNPVNDNYSYTKKLQVNLVGVDKDILTVWEGEDKEEAFAAAQFLAQNLSLKTLNATQSPFVWFN
jgi:hypothetical protein